MSVLVDFGVKVTEEEPEITFIDRCGATVDLGESYDGFANIFFDKHLVIDVKIPSSSFQKKPAKRAKLYDDDPGW